MTEIYPDVWILCVECWESHSVSVDSLHWDTISWEPLGESVGYRRCPSCERETYHLRADSWTTSPPWRDG